MNENERKPVQEMTDRELLEEILILLRAGEDAVRMVSQNPMLGAMIPGLG